MVKLPWAWLGRACATLRGTELVMVTVRMSSRAEAAGRPPRLCMYIFYAHVRMYRNHAAQATGCHRDEHLSGRDEHLSGRGGARGAGRSRQRHVVRCASPIASTIRCRWPLVLVLGLRLRRVCKCRVPLRHCEPSRASGGAWWNSCELDTRGFRGALVSLTTPSAPSHDTNRVPRYTNRSLHT